MNCKHLTYRSNKKVRTLFCRLNKCFNPICTKECFTPRDYKPLKTKIPLKSNGKRMKNRSSKLSKACDISNKVKQIVYERDKGLCVICKQPGIPNMHYIARSQLGLGIEQNIVCGCIKCHNEYDNGKMREHHGEVIKKHLQSQYENWNEKELIYRKYEVSK